MDPRLYGLAHHSPPDFFDMARLLVFDLFRLAVFQNLIAGFRYCLRSGVFGNRCQLIEATFFKVNSQSLNFTIYSQITILISSLDSLHDYRIYDSLIAEIWL